jgi:hypothetical protein
MLLAAVAYGVIAGLGSYIAIHLPFWLWDLLRHKVLRRGGNRYEALRCKISSRRESACSAVSRMCHACQSFGPTLHESFRT